MTHTPQRRLVRPVRKTKPAPSSAARKARVQPRILYRGPSLYDGVNIIAVISGVSSGRQSQNEKTGKMPQVWILPESEDPRLAVKNGKDVSVCGDCPLRGAGGCYVNIHHGPRSVWAAYHRGVYALASDTDLAEDLSSFDVVRIGAYGDPAMVPFSVWERLAKHVRLLGYTHAWRYAYPRLKEHCMASVETLVDAERARKAGWRYFRLRTPAAPLSSGEFMCPASSEAGKSRTCLQCKACDGTQRSDRKPSPVIAVHGYQVRRAEKTVGAMVSEAPALGGVDSALKKPRKPTQSKAGGARLGVRLLSFLLKAGKVYSVEGLCTTLGAAEEKVLSRLKSLEKQGKVEKCGYDERESRWAAVFPPDPGPWDLLEHLRAQGRGIKTKQIALHFQVYSEHRRGQNEILKRLKLLSELGFVHAEKVSRSAEWVITTEGKRHLAVRRRDKREEAKPRTALSIRESRRQIWLWLRKRHRGARVSSLVDEFEARGIKSEHACHDLEWLIEHGYCSALPRENGSSGGETQSWTATATKKEPNW